MKKSKMNLSHNASLTADMGYLVPFCVIDCLPNDSHRLKLQSFVRAQPMVAPLMHIVNLYAQYWFVPYRLLWNDWEEFITGGNDGNSDKNLTFPTIKIKPEVSSLADYFGLPVNGKELEVSAMPFRAMAEIWNSRYRDEDLQGEVPISYDGGLDTTTNTSLLRCAWAKDRFTTARPFTQRGSQISVPVQSYNFDANQKNQCVVHLDNSITIRPSTTNSVLTLKSVTIKSAFFSNVVRLSDTNIQITIPSFTANRSGDTITASDQFGNTVSFTTDRTHSGYVVPESSYYLRVSDIVASGDPVTAEDITLAVGGKATVVATFGSSASAQSINIRDLRAASALQRYQERSLEYGNRYEEFIQREFGIKPRDSRIQRPEYIGGGKSILQISEVLQTAEGTDTGVGTMRGHGVSAFSTRGIRFRCAEHGVIIGLLSIRPHAVYSQGVEKFWRKFAKLDYFVPELANIGMQEIFQSELYANGENFQTVFGYEPRYNEYRKMPNRIAGEFRGGQVLDYWNLSRNFDAPPVLNSSFITMEPSKRVFAEQTQNSFLIMLYNQIRSFRPVPKRAKNILR